MFVVWMVTIDSRVGVTPPSNRKPPSLVSGTRAAFRLRRNTEVYIPGGVVVSGADIHSLAIWYRRLRVRAPDFGTPKYLGGLRGRQALLGDLVP